MKLTCLAAGALLLGSAQSALAQVCRSEYSLEFGREPYKDPLLRVWIATRQGAQLSEVVASAKAAGYSKAQTVAMLLAQGDGFDEMVEEYLVAAKSKSSSLGELSKFVRQGLPSNYSCSGAEGSAICSAQMSYWQAEFARQAAAGTECLW